MSASSNKKMKLLDDPKETVSIKTGVEGNTFRAIKLYICPDNIGPKRLEIMKRSAIKNGFELSINMK